MQENVNGNVRDDERPASAAEMARGLFELDTLGHPVMNRKDRRKMMKAAGAFKKKRRR